jgi:hypothetical protein
MSEIPSFLSHLKQYGEYPVPFVQMWIDGKPDFRVIDPVKVVECMEQKLCAICGVKLGEFCWFIGGESCKHNKLFLDAPMHEQCAVFASKTCPFVSGKREEYSTRPLDTSKVRTEKWVSTQPTKMFLFKSRTKQVKHARNGDTLMFKAGVWNRITQIR